MKVVSRAAYSAACDGFDGLHGILGISLDKAGVRYRTHPLIVSARAKHPPLWKLGAFPVLAATESVLWGVFSTHIWCHRALQPLFEQQADNWGISSAFRECRAEEGWSRTQALGSPWGSGCNSGLEMLTKLTLSSLVSQVGVTRPRVSHFSHHDYKRQLEVLDSLLFGLISVSLARFESTAHHLE